MSCSSFAAGRSGTTRVAHAERQLEIRAGIRRGNVAKHWGISHYGRFDRCARQKGIAPH